jgi:hypothetical protein
MKHTESVIQSDSEILGGRTGRDTTAARTRQSMRYLRRPIAVTISAWIVFGVKTENAPVVNKKRIDFNSAGLENRGIHDILRALHPRIERLNLAALGELRNASAEALHRSDGVEGGGQLVSPRLSVVAETQRLDRAHLSAAARPALPIPVKHRPRPPNRRTRRRIFVESSRPRTARRSRRGLRPR